MLHPHEQTTYFSMSRAVLNAFHDTGYAAWGASCDLAYFAKWTYIASLPDGPTGPSKEKQEVPKSAHSAYCFRVTVDTMMSPPELTFLSMSVGAEQNRED